MKVAKTVTVEIPNLGVTIGAAVKKDARSVQVLATAVGISDATLYNIINEKHGQVKIETIERLENLLGIDLGVNFDMGIVEL